MALSYLGRRTPDEPDVPQRWIEPLLNPESRRAQSEVFDSGRKTIVDCAHVRVERLDTVPVLFSKVFKQYEDLKGQKYDYRYWAERENLFLREFLKRQNEFTRVVQARHLISENEAAKQVLTCDAGITIANWLRVKARYADTATLSHPFQRADAFLHLLRACLEALKQIHEHRVVHCDIKEDNICIPYAPCPFPEDGRSIRLEFDRLKLIDFAFSIAHAIPLTQILVINPEERVPYQSELLVDALHADRKSGSPNAVQQLDYRVDLFSLGYLAEKISAAGLDWPAGRGERSEELMEDVRGLIGRLKAFDKLPPSDVLPHDALIEAIGRLLARAEGPAASLESASLRFHVDGEWTAGDMVQSASRKTPLTPVAPPLPTPIAQPVAPVPPHSRSMSWRTLWLWGCLALAAGIGGAYLYAVTLAPHRTPAAASQKAPAAAKVDAAAVAESLAAMEAETLAAAGSTDKRSAALDRLKQMAKEGNAAATQRLAAFEAGYDATKQTLAKSAWWTRGEGPQPAESSRWMEDGRLLAAIGDRPAMLDMAFALGHGRAVAQDRAAAVNMYMKVIARSEGADEASKRIRQSSVRGLLATLNAVVAQKDQAAARRVLPDLESKAYAGAADIQYYLGLFSECVSEPADLDAALQWYRKSAADPAWKAVAERKAQLLGRWCPGS